MKHNTTPNRQDLINDKVVAFKMWVKRWEAMASISVEERAMEALRTIRKITFDCEKLNGGK